MNLFSVVIPCFNSAKTISKALKSLKNQTLKDFEVILVDDASSDYPVLLEIVEQFKPTLEILVVRNITNKNGSHSRNRGIDIATSKYIAFLDSDDEWVPDRLEKAQALINEQVEMRFIIYGRFELIQNHASGPLLPLRAKRSEELVSEYVFAAGQHMQTSTFVCPTMVAREIKFDESLSRHQDSDFMMRAQSLGVLIVHQNHKCSYYNFKIEDVKSRVASGRITSIYCSDWLSKKRALFNKAAISGYNLQVFSRVLYLEGRYFQSVLFALAGLQSVGIKNLIDLIKTKLIIVIKARMGM